MSNIFCIINFSIMVDIFIFSILFRIRFNYVDLIIDYAFHSIYHTNLIVFCH